jgi:hypothetical protein
MRSLLGMTLKALVNLIENNKNFMRNNRDRKIVNLMDLNDYVVLYVLENHLRITTD